MSFNSEEFYTNKKKNKVSSLKYSSKFDIAVQIFLVTFIAIFIAVVASILKYSSKINIDTTNETQAALDRITETYSDEQRPIDKRLILIQQEENSPNEAKIIAKETYDNEEVVNPSFFEEEKKQKKLERYEQAKAAANSENKVSNIEDEDDEFINKKQVEEKKLKPRIKNENYIQSNIVVASKVLVGKFTTLDEALQKQNEIKENNPKSTPYVKKVGDVFSIQMGSYEDFATAKSAAASLKSKGYDVWIYQQ